MPDVVEIIPEGVAPGALWQPVVGEEFESLLLRQSKLDNGQKEVLKRESVDVLARCMPPTEPTSDRTGLVFGYVQSGKTLSFISVAALARDNGYQMVIVIGGISKNLLGQSHGRLIQELGLPPIGTSRKWRLFQNPKPEQAVEVRQTLSRWDDKDLPDKRKSAVLVTVMKESTHLNNLSKLLSQLDLQGRAVLIIDDEADQASMDGNARKPTPPTAINRLVSGLKGLVPHHTLLQYTATPQAPLLISLFDSLSPSFVRVLPPGKGYVGGAQFFAPGSPYVKLILDEAELPSNKTAPSNLPKTLHQAMRIFFLGVAASEATDDVEGNRSMLVHPSQNTGLHEVYDHWVRRTQHDWLDRLEREDGDPDKASLIQSFREDYGELARTVEDLPPFDELLRHLHRAIRMTEVTLVNATGKEAPSVDFASVYSHIVVGGQLMDRGFTVEGLTVTYLPRPLGVGNADTLQQRARFFGYKQRYLGYCRVYLATEVSSAFTAYVDSEEHIRRQLAKHQDLGLSLKDWRRVFILDPSLKPTRKNVLPLQHRRLAFGGGWTTTLAIPNDDGRRSNQDLVKELVNRRTFREWAGGPPTYPHLVASASLREVADTLLTDWVGADEQDSEKLYALRVLLEDYLGSHDEECLVLHMNGGQPRERTLEDGRLKDDGRLFQGQGPNYLGDERSRAQAGFTLQIHNILDKSSGKEFPVLALYCPSEMNASLVVGEFEEFISA